MNLFQNIMLKFQNKTKTSYSVNSKRPITIGQFGFSNLNIKNFDLTQEGLLQLLNDEVAVRCSQLIINSVLSGGYKVKCQDESKTRLIENLINNIGYEQKTEFLLNSTLTTGGDCFAYFEKKDNGKYNLKIESMFWNGRQRLTLEADPQSNELTGKITIKNGFFSKIDDVSLEDCIVFQSINLNNYYIGITPLMLVANKIIEKQTLESMNKEIASKSGRLEGIFSLKTDWLKDISPIDRINQLADMETIIDELSNSSTNLRNYAIVNLPLEYQKIQSTPAEMQYRERIEQINYAICTAFGVPPSLVQFSSNNDPNLANAGQYRDNFAELNTNYYKSKIEKFWKEVIKKVLPDIEFEFFVSREETDESIALREQFRQSIEDCKTLRELGINAKPSLKGLELLGIEIDNQESEEYTVVDAIDSSVKTPNNLFTKAVSPKVPDVDTMLKSKGFRQFKSAIHDQIKSQLDKLFSQKTKLSRYSDDKFYQEVLTALPTIQVKEEGLYDLIKKNILPSLLEQYNEFYNTDYKLDNLPDTVLETIKELATYTVKGDANYGGINGTTATALTNSVAQVLGKKDLSLDDYSKLTDTQKKQVWTELRTNSKNVILQSRTDLLSEMLASGSFQQAYAKLAEVDGNTFVGVYTSKDKRVRPSHKINEGMYFETSLKQPWTDALCRCTYIFGTEKSLLDKGFNKL